MATHSSIPLKVTEYLNSMYIYNRQDIKVWAAIYFQTPFINKHIWYPLEFTPGPNIKVLRVIKTLTIITNV